MNLSTGLIIAALLCAISLVAAAGVIVNHMEKLFKPEPQKAHWIDAPTYPDIWYECSNCGEGLDFPSMFCPHCGRLMVEDVEK